jgi:hypothetical protein
MQQMPTDACLDDLGTRRVAACGRTHALLEHSASGAVRAQNHHLDHSAVVGHSIDLKFHRFVSLARSLRAVVVVGARRGIELHIPVSVFSLSLTVRCVTLHPQIVAF